jgi:predicted transcriptional regulator
MSRLTKKKLLRHRRKGNTYHFSATCSAAEFGARQGAGTVAQLLENYGDAALAGILSQLAATPEAVSRLTALLESEDEQQA